MQGPAQKIMYVHVPSAWCAFLAFGLVGICSGLFLWLGDRRLDTFSEASAEVGVVLTGLVLITGPMWGKPIWGTWWQWEPRLTSTLFLFFLFVGYLTLRRTMFDPAERARYSAVVGILGAMLRAVHPPQRLHVPHHPSAARRAQPRGADDAGLVRGHAARSRWRRSRCCIWAW